MSTLCSRMVWPYTAVAGATVVVNGRVYVKAPGVFDAMNQDISGLQSAGAVLLCQSGALPNNQLGNTGLPAAGVQLSGIQGGIQGSNIASVPDVSSPDPQRPIPVTLATNATTASTTAVLHFGSSAATLAALASVIPGMTAKDNTATGAITTQTVSSVNYATGDVTMSANLTTNVGSADSITFSPAIGTEYLDAALNRAIVWDGNYWHDLWNNQIV